MPTRCPNCDVELYIETWNGFFWECPLCDFQGKRATDEEMEAWEEENGGICENPNLEGDK